VTPRRYDLADDDISRQRRKRDARLLAQELPGTADTTIGELVADLVAAIATGGEREDGRDLDVRGYMADRGHTGRTIDAVEDYLERQGAWRLAPSAIRPRP
jgi:hypothetical protein